MTPSIVLTVCAKHNIAPEVFFSEHRSPRLSRARKEAAKALYATGLSQKAVGRLIRKDKSTAFYWLNDGARARKRAAARNRPKPWETEMRSLDKAPRTTQTGAA